jgi:hypothetical protein
LFNSHAEQLRLFLPFRGYAPTTTLETTEQSAAETVVAIVAAAEAGNAVDSSGDSDIVEDSDTKQFP